MEDVLEVSSSSPISMAEDPLLIEKFAIRTLDESEPANTEESQSEQNSSEALELNSSNGSSEDISSVLSDVSQGSQEGSPATSNTPSPGPGCEQSTDPAHKEVILKRGPSNTSLTSTRAPRKKLRDGHSNKTETALKIKVEDTHTTTSSSNSAAAELEKRLLSFTQYIKEQETARAKIEQLNLKARQLESDVDSNFVSVKELPFLLKPWKPIERAGRMFKPKTILPIKKEKEALLLRITVSAVQDPRHVYVIPIDEERDRCKRMLEEMQTEIEIDHQEYPEVWIGHVCAVNHRNQWCRALVEEEKEGDLVTVFFVDTGRRLTIPIRNCYHLPDKFLEMPVQALRCVLDSLLPAPDSVGCGLNSELTWSWQAMKYLGQLRDKTGIVLIERLSLGQVGKLPKSKEFAVHCILHLVDEDVSANRWLCDNGHAETDRKTDIPNCGKLLLELAADQLSQASCSVTEDDRTSVVSFCSLRSKDVACFANQTCNRVPVWYEFMGSPAPEGFYDGLLHETRQSLLKPSEQVVIIPAGMGRPGIARDSNRRENPIAAGSEANSQSLEPVDEVCLGPVLFSWCESPMAIYAQTEEMRKTLTKLVEDMGQHYQDTEQTGSGYFELGYRCAVYCDEQWWRAEITENDEYPVYRVRLLDRGYRCTVKASDIRPLDAKFEESEKLVYRLYLKGIYPIAGNVWGKEIRRFITERLTDGEDIHFRYRKHEQLTGDYLLGTIFYTYDLEEGPLQLGGLTKINMIDELVSLELAGLRPAPAKFVGKPRTWRPPSYPNPDERFWAKVTWVNMQGEIFLHDVRTEGILEDISRVLTRKYENSQPNKADLNVKPGDICIAKYSDGKWYRCTVKEVHREEGTATLLYEDYGTKDATSLRDIRINTILEDIPIQGWRCKLCNVKPVGDSWDWDTLTAIHTLIVEKEFTCRVVAKQPAFTVIMRNVKGKLLSTQLVRKGLANFDKAPTKQKTIEEILLVDDDEHF